MELMKQVYDGTSGVSMQMGQKKPMESGEITDAKVQMDLMAELNYEKYGIKASLKGVGKVDEEDAYVIELTKADGEVSTDYYSVNSGLKLMSVSTESEGEEPVMAETRYVEYATVNGVKYASKTKQTVGPQEMEFIYSDMKINPKLNDKDFAVEK
jgi:outer membrane lipoprotein-sorting protein